MTYKNATTSILQIFIRLARFGFFTCSNLRGGAAKIAPSAFCALYAIPLPLFLSFLLILSLSRFLTYLTYCLSPPSFLPFSLSFFSFVI